MFKKLVLNLCVVVTIVKAFPDGAPADVCVKMRANQPNHGKARSQAIESLPYQVVATTDKYQPGSQIQVTVSGHDVFRGFFLQARDAQTNEWIGEWQESANTKTIPECSAITHADNKDKTQAVFLWKAPAKSGSVFFTGTILKDYGTFWSDIIAQIPVQHQQY